MVVVMFRFEDNQVGDITDADVFRAWANDRVGEAYRSGKWDGIEMKAEVVDAE